LDPLGALEVGEHEDVKKLGASRWAVTPQGAAEGVLNLL
jgi:hypothetical protein